MSSGIMYGVAHAQAEEDLEGPLDIFSWRSLPDSVGRWFVDRHDTGVPRHLVKLARTFIALPSETGAPHGIARVSHDDGHLLLRWCAEDPTGERSAAVASVVLSEGDAIALLPMELQVESDRLWEKAQAEERRRGTSLWETPKE